MSNVIKTKFTLTALETTLAFSALFGEAYTAEKLYKDIEKNKDLNPELFAEANALKIFKVSDDSDMASILAKMLGCLEVSYYELSEYTIGDDNHGVFEGLESYFKKKLGINIKESTPNFIEGDIQNNGWVDFIQAMNVIYKTHGTVEHDLNEFVDFIRNSIADNKKNLGADAGLFDFTIDNWANDLLLGETLVGKLMKYDELAIEVDETHFVRYTGGLDLEGVEIWDDVTHCHDVMNLGVDEDITYSFTFEALRNAKRIDNTSWEVKGSDDDEEHTLSFYEVNLLSL